jgi:tetratricopeptide (TPR) repeat protein
LGLTLYELLTLRPAFEATDRHTMIRRVMNDEPERLRNLAPHLPRDLNTIVEKAIARDPSQRYATAALLSEDLQRFLDDKPIKARRVSSTEQAWRWARRNPAVASLATGLLVAMAVGLIGVTWQWRKAASNLAAAELANRKAQERFGLAMDAVRTFTTGASEDVLLREKQLAGLRNKLLEGSLGFYDRLTASLEGESDRASRRSLAQAIYDAAVLNGRIGRQGEALAAHLKAVGLRLGLTTDAPEDAIALSELCKSELALGETFHVLGRHDEARQALARSRAIAERLIRDRPSDQESRVILADGFRNDGQWLYLAGRISESRPQLEQALKGYESLLQAETSRTSATSGHNRYLRGRASCSFLIGACVNAGNGGTEAVEWLEQAITDYEELTGRVPDDLDFWLELAECHTQMCECLTFNIDNSRARLRQSFRRAEAILERLARVNPTVTKTRKIWAELLCISGGNNAIGWRSNERLEKLKHGVELYRELIESDPGIPRIKAAYGQGLSIYGFALWQAGRRSEGIRLLKESMDFFESKDFTDLSYGEAAAADGRMQGALNLAIALALSGQVLGGIDVVERSLLVGERILLQQDNRFVRIILARNLALHSYLAYGVGKRTAASRSAERAAIVLQPLELPPYGTWLLGAIHMLWYLEGRPAAVGRVAEPRGRPEYADSAIDLLRRAAGRGYVELEMTSVFFGPVLGSLPEFQQLMMDLPFPADPFMPMPDPPDVGPLPPASGNTP